MTGFRITKLALVALSAVSLVAGCRTSDGLRRRYLERLEKILPAPSRPVIVIPGFGVSRLYDPVTNGWVWGTPRTTVITSYQDDLDLPLVAGDTVGHDRLEPRGFAGSRGPVNTAWQLAIALQKFGGYRIARWTRDGQDPPTAYLFEHDWRLSALDTAERLDQLIETIRREHGDPNLQVDLLTHSAGANVAIAYLRMGAGDDDTRNAGFATSTSKVRSLVMVAPPRRGTLEAFKLLVRGEKVIRRRFDPAMAATWPAVLEVLPHDPVTFLDETGAERQIDLHDIDAWRSLEMGLFDPVRSAEIRDREGEAGWERRVRTFEHGLERAKSVSDLLERPLRGVEAVTILGDCVPTVSRILVREDRSFVFYSTELRTEERRFLERLFGPGDGTVGAASAGPAEGEEVVRLCSGHQGLAIDPASQRTILRVLLE